MLAIKILYKYYLDFRNLITLLFFCMEQGLEFRWIWVILGQISKNIAEIKKKTSRSLLLSRKCLNSQKSAALQKLPIYSDFSLLCPIHLLLPTFFLSLRKRKEFDDTKRIFSFQFIRRKHSQLPIQNFFCGPQKTLRQTWKFSKISLQIYGLCKREFYFMPHLLWKHISFLPFCHKRKRKIIIFGCICYQHHDEMI